MKKSSRGRLSVPKYKVTWSKVYIASGTVEVEASTEEEAEVKVRDDIGKYTGLMQYLPDEDRIEVTGEVWMAYDSQTKCIRCGKSIPPVSEGASPEELPLCDLCYSIMGPNKANRVLSIQEAGPDAPKHIKYHKPVGNYVVCTGPDCPICKLGGDEVKSEE